MPLALPLALDSLLCAQQRQATLALAICWMGFLSLEKNFPPIKLDGTLACKNFSEKTVSPLVAPSGKRRNLLLRLY